MEVANTSNLLFQIDSVESPLVNMAMDGFSCPNQRVGVRKVTQRPQFQRARLGVIFFLSSPGDVTQTCNCGQLFKFSFITSPRSINHHQLTMESSCTTSFQAPNLFHLLQIVAQRPLEFNTSSNILSVVE